MARLICWGAVNATSWRACLNEHTHTLQSRRRVHYWTSDQWQVPTYRQLAFHPPCPLFKIIDLACDGGHVDPVRPVASPSGVDRDPGRPLGLTPPRHGRQPLRTSRGRCVLMATACQQLPCYLSTLSPCFFFNLLCVDTWDITNV
jgi:hypothetical protein